MIFTLYPWLAIEETSLRFFTAPVTLHENELISLFEKKSLGISVHLLFSNKKCPHPAKARSISVVIFDIFVKKYSFNFLCIWSLLYVKFKILAIFSHAGDFLHVPLGTSSPPKWKTVGGWISWCKFFSSLNTCSINLYVDLKQELAVSSVNNCMEKYRDSSFKSFRRNSFLSNSFHALTSLSWRAILLLMAAWLWPGKSNSGITWIWRSFAWRKISL